MTWGSPILRNLRIKKKLQKLDVQRPKAAPMAKPPRTQQPQPGSIEMSWPSAHEAPQAWAKTFDIQGLTLLYQTNSFEKYTKKRKVWADIK